MIELLTVPTADQAIERGNRYTAGARVYGYSHLGRLCGSQDILKLIGNTSCDRVVTFFRGFSMKCIHMYIKTHVQESSDLNYSWQSNIGSNSKVNQQCNGLPPSEHLKNKQQLRETI